MKRNVGNIDRIVRVSAAFVVSGLYFSNLISGSLAVILGVGAVVMLVTGLSGWCGLYSIFGYESCKTEE